MSAPADLHPLMTYEDVMSYTGYSRRFLQEAVKNGKLKWTGAAAAKRFRKADVDVWLDSLAGVVRIDETPRPVRRGKPKPYIPVILKR